MARNKMLLTTLATVLIAGSAWAQEPATEEDQSQEPTQEDQSAEPTHRIIKWRENPYDIASFYRSHQADGYFGYGRGWYGGVYGRYPRFYRQRPMYGRFWNSGYLYGRGRTGLVGFNRSIGENGDLFLLAPTILAPIGPLTGVFYEGR